jgi:DNA-directed RNA polymerase subunit K/omega
MLVTTVAKRARQLVANADGSEEENPVSVAAAELMHDQLRVKFPEDYQRHDV